MAILTGGQSSRMGASAPKALADLGGTPLLGHVIARLGPLSDDLFLVGGDPALFAGFGLPHCADHFGLKAAVCGIYSALAAARHELCLVVSCDTPFVPARLARLMAVGARGHDAVVPRGERGAEPLFSLYRRSCMPALRRAIDSGEFSPRRALAGLAVREVGAAEAALVCDTGRSFFNVNTETDLEAARRMLAAEPAAGPEDAPLSAPGGAPLVCFCGRKDSGKTTFVEKLTRLLASRGLAVTYIKHDVHGFEMDRPGADTDRLMRAGATEAIIASPQERAARRRLDGDPGLGEVAAEADPAADII
ncbi:MAG: molybdopterin-guanine dinucleotide biosynthesis protein MobB, partial [Pseudomonadota bacterium]